jgi:hypothetical protein
MPLAATAIPLATPLDQEARSVTTLDSLSPVRGHYRQPNNTFCNNSNNSSSNNNNSVMVSPFPIEDHFHLHQRHPTMAATMRTSTHSMQTSYPIL